MNDHAATLDPELEADLRAYYTKHYRDELCLPEWQQYVDTRITEVDLPRKRLETLVTWFNRKLTPADRVLVVGAGTGAEMEAFLEFDCDVQGVEPNPEALSIARRKCAQRGDDPWWRSTWCRPGPEAGRPTPRP